LRCALQTSKVLQISRVAPLQRDRARRSASRASEKETEERQRGERVDHSAASDPEPRGSSGRERDREQQERKVRGNQEHAAVAAAAILGAPVGTLPSKKARLHTQELPGDRSWPAKQQQQQQEDVDDGALNASLQEVSRQPSAPMRKPLDGLTDLQPQQRIWRGCSHYFFCCVSGWV
jgi:hypothetical protein